MSPITPTTIQADKKPMTISLINTKNDHFLNQQQQSKLINMARDSFSGLIGGTCCMYAGLPLDVVKVRLQTSSPASSTTFVGTFRTIISNEGFWSLWKGAGPALSSALVENATVFAARGHLEKTYICARNYIFPNSYYQSVYFNNNISFKESAFLNGASGVFSATAMCPFEVMKVRMQLDRTAMMNITKVTITTTPAIETGAAIRTGFLDVAQTVYKENGAKGFFKGLSANIARDVPFYFLFFTFYETYINFATNSLPYYVHSAKRCLGYGNYNYVEGPKTQSKRDLNPMHFIFGGGLAGMFAWSLVFPIDVIKSRCQSSRCNSNNIYNSLGLFGIARKVIHEEGMRSMMKGYQAAVLRGFPSNGALFLGYEWSNMMFDIVFQK